MTREIGLRSGVIPDCRRCAGLSSSSTEPGTDIPGPADCIFPLRSNGAGSSGTRGASARARLQMELAAHKGSFCEAVMQSMSRQMAPTSSANAFAEEILQRGVSGASI